MKNNKLLLALLIIPALSACDIFSPHKDKSNSYSDNTSITSISETSTDITSEDINSNSDNSGQSSESSNDQQEEYPTYPVTVEENPEVIWDDSQKSQRTGNKVIDFYNINDIHDASICEIAISASLPCITRRSKNIPFFICLFAFF